MAQVQTQAQKRTQMLETPVERLILKLAAPTIVTMLISAMYNMADTYFVGTVGTSATAAVSVVFSFMSIIQAIGFLFGHGGGNYISRKMGANQMEDAKTMASTAFFTAFFFGSLLAAAGLLFLEELARFLGATDMILPYTKEYLRFILLGTPFMTSSLMLNNLLRFQGSAFYGMIGMTSGAVLNVVLDPIFIHGFHMGVKGASLATMISQMVSFCILLIGCAQKGNIAITFKQFAPRWQYYKQIIRGGSPSLFRQGLASIAVIFLNRTAGVYGEAAIAAMGVTSRVAMLAFSAMLGFGQGFQPVCGFNYGAGRYDRVRQGYWFCVKIAVAVLACFAVVFFLFSPLIISVFRDDAQVIAIGKTSLRLQALTIPFMSLITMTNMLLQTIGKSKQASFLAVARQGLFFLPILFVCAGRFGLLGVQLAQPLADICTFLLAIPLTVSIMAEMKGQEKGAAEANIL